MKFTRSTLSALLLSCVCMAGASHADGAKQAPPMANLFEALSDRGIRSSLQGKDLTASWRILHVTAKSDADMFLIEVMGGGRRDMPEDELYYTRGDIISVTQQNYLVAYRLMPSSDPKEQARYEQFVQAWQNNRKEMGFKGEFPPLEEKSELSLSLISIGDNTNFNDIRAFDPKQDILTTGDNAKRKAQIDRVVSQSNLKQIALGVMQYVQDYDEILPPMRAAYSGAEFTNPSNSSASTQPVQLVLQPYLKSTQIFLHPATGRPYLPNYKISRMDLSSIENEAKTFLFFEDAPDAEGKRSVAFLDGHVEAMTEAEFQRRRKAQGISASGFPPSAVKVKQKTKPKQKTKARSPSPKT